MTLSVAGAASRFISKGIKNATMAGKVVDQIA
jgi:hypothetical protein